MSMTTAGNNPLKQDKLLYENFLAGAQTYTPAFPEIFTTKTPQRVTERVAITAASSLVSEVADGAAYPVEGYSEVGSQNITQKVFKTSIGISDLTDLFVDQNYESTMGMVRSKGYSMMYAIDQLCAAFFNNATSTTSPYGMTIGGISTPLVGNTQAIGNTGSTQDNRIAGSLDVSTANEARVALAKMKDHNGIPGTHMLKRVVVPFEEQKNAWEIFMSPGSPDSSNNNRNFLNSIGQVKIIPWHLLSSTTACFLLSDKGEYGTRGLMIFIKEMPSIKRTINQANGLPEYQMRMVLNAGVADYQGVVSVGL